MGLGELSVLDHVSLTAAVEQFKYGNLTVLHDFFVSGSPPRTDGGDAFRYDVLKANRGVAKPKAPGAPTKRVALTAVGTKSGTCIHAGEHKMLSGDIVVRLREPGTRQVNAKAQLARELLSLDRRRARFRNLAVAQMLTGALAINEADVVASVDYGVSESHKPTAQTSWAGEDTDIFGDLDAWIDLIEKDSGYTPVHAWCNRTVMRFLMNSAQVKEFLGDGDYKAQIGKWGYIRELHGLTWHVYGAGYVPDGGSFTRFIADDKLILCPEPDGEWCDVIEGSTMIRPLDAQDLVEVFGKHAYTILEADPAGYKLCDGDCFIPALFVPDAIVYADVTPAQQG